MRHKVAVVNLNISYHIPVPLRVIIQGRGRIKSQDGRTFTYGTNRLPDGIDAVSGKGIYVDAEHFRLLKNGNKTTENHHQRSMTLICGDP
jgi:hypothetical protein